MENAKSNLPKLWLSRKWSLIFFGYIGILVLISNFAYRSQLSGLLTRHDKLGHFVLFGSLGLLSHLALNCRCWSIGRLILPAGPCLIGLLVIVDESLQSLSPKRTAGIPDLIANWLGILVFVSIAMHLMKRKSLSRA